MTGKARIMDLIIERRDLLNELRRLTLLQTSILEKEDVEGFVSNLDMRQSVLERLTAVQDRIEAHAEASRDDQVTRALDTEAGRIVAEIAEADAKNHDLAVAMRDRFGAEAKRMSQSRKSVSLYAAGETVTNTGYLDTKS